MPQIGVSLNHLRKFEKFEKVIDLSFLKNKSDKNGFEFIISVSNMPRVGEEIKLLLS